MPDWVDPVPPQDEPVPALPLADIVAPGDEEPLPAMEIDTEKLRRPRPPQPGFWAAVLWCLGFLAITQLVPGVIGVVILVVLVVGSPGGMEQLQNNPQAMYNSDAFATAMMPALLLAQILGIITSWVVIRIVVGKHWPAILALRRPSVAHLVLALAGLPGLMVITMGIDGLAKRFVPSLFDLEQMMGIFGKWPWPVGVLIIGVGPGIAEELWCRGFLGRGLVGRYGVVGGVLLTSLLFGLIHMEPRQVAYAMVMGIFLHGAYLTTRSLLVPILLHMTNNSLSVLALHVPALQAIDMPAEQIPWTVYVTAILLTASVSWALFQSRARLVDWPGAEQTAITNLPGLNSITADPGTVHLPAGLDLPTWRPSFPSVADPPPGKATRVMRPWPAWHSWLVAAAGLSLFVGSCFLAN